MTAARTLTAELRRRALEEGFDRVGIARAERLARDAATLESWLAAGRHASMGWMERHVDKRGDPRLLLPGAQAVVVCAANYWPGAAPANAGGRVAAYAQGRDVHVAPGRRAFRS